MPKRPGRERNKPLGKVRNNSPVPPEVARNAVATQLNANQGQYCTVDPGNPVAVDAGPSTLPQNWVSPYSGNEYYNINNSDVWTDPNLLQIGWYPYVLNDAGEPQDGKSYDRSLSDFTIQPTFVERNAIYTEWSQAKYDQNEPVAPIDWLDIPPEQRQFVDTPYQSQDRLVIGRIFQTWNTPDDIYALRATLYTAEDADGMSVKIYDDAGTYLYPMELLPPGDPSNPFPVEENAWFSETPSGAWGQHLERKAWRYYIFKGVDLTPEMRMPLEAENLAHDIKWNPNGFSSRFGARRSSPEVPAIRRLVSIAKKEKLL